MLLYYTNISLCHNSQRAHLIHFNKLQCISLVYQNFCDLRGVYSLLNLLHTAPTAQVSNVEGEEGEQQQPSCPCQLDPTHPPSGKRVSCVLCDISTITASWKSCMHCQHCQHQWFKCVDWQPWPKHWIHHCCECPHSRGQTAKLSSSRSVHATSVIGLTDMLAMLQTGLSSSSSTCWPMTFQFHKPFSYDLKCF